MYAMSGFQLWREHREDLLRQVERRRLIGELWAAGQKERFRLRNGARAKSKTKAPVLPTGEFRDEAREEDRGLAGVPHR